MLPQLLAPYGMHALIDGSFLDWRIMSCNGIRRPRQAL